MDHRKKTIEERTGDAVLQTSQTIQLGGKTYEVAKPTVATVIRLSELTSHLTDAKIEKDTQILSYVLENAKDCTVIGEIIATLICGYHKSTKKPFRGLFKKRINPVKNLSRTILEQCSPAELNAAVVKLLGMQQIAFFFSTITSLREKNILKPTKKSEEKQAI